MEPQLDREVFLFRSEAKSYSKTTTTFIKRELPDAVGLPWLKERFTVEAAALRLLSEKTSIPVPRLIAAGQDEDGLCYLVTEYIHGSVRGDMAALECRMPQLHLSSQAGSPCAVCEGIVRANANQFVRKQVLPQLRSLKSETTGLGGIVIPPRWVSESDTRETWPVLSSRQADFVFCHHDLVLHNMLFCTQTLDVLALVDMEECGFFPPEVQQWKYDRAGQFELYENMDLVQKHIQLIGG
ncbi:hypothetical protein BU26DRAFT_144847 [Trematosphaeria pertusa]|uniref:Aminoglycoside phosphotransferase domain-containing protein n=1 Tax=Trematosphaeria pertusa TaxID=390896 RepID=A0A6A6IW36_9PLEO|nr:uncharacterized protein BU26DRAFT_144847 [Trematosphaeria pertusa]KAF2254765.1 hypothetical protein BU26DRAFT_144847 [Trematosphaeria pertusa]